MSDLILNQPQISTVEDNIDGQLKPDVKMDAHVDEIQKSAEVVMEEAAPLPVEDHEAQVAEMDGREEVTADNTSTESHGQPMSDIAKEQNGLATQDGPDSTMEALTVVPNMDFAAQSDPESKHNEQGDEIQETAEAKAEEPIASHVIVPAETKHVGSGDATTQEQPRSGDKDLRPVDVQMESETPQNEQSGEDSEHSAKVESTEAEDESSPCKRESGRCPVHSTARLYSPEVGEMIANNSFFIVQILSGLFYVLMKMKALRDYGSEVLERVQKNFLKPTIEQPEGVSENDGSQGSSDMQKAAEQDPAVEISA